MDSPYFLHMQHHSSTMTCLFLRLFKVKILPSVVVQTKKAIHVGALFLQMLFEGKARLAGAKRIIKSFDLECSPFGWEPTNPIPTTLIQLDRVKEIEENGDHLHLQIMHGFDGGNILLTGVIRKQQMVCSLLQTATLNNTEKASFKVLSSHHMSRQNRILCLSFTLNLTNLEECPPSPLIFLLIFLDLVS